MADADMLCALDMVEELRPPPPSSAFDLHEKILGGGLCARVLEERTTMLHVAVYFGSEGVAELPLDEGADIEVIDASGATPVERAFAGGFPGHAAERRKPATVVSLLLKRGASTKRVKLPDGEDDLETVLSKAMS